jgi:rhodanese-related sulfurtransferase
VPLLIENVIVKRLLRARFEHFGKKDRRHKCCPLHSTIAGSGQNGLLVSALLLGGLWAFAAAGKASGGYPNATILAGAEWLYRQKSDEGLVLVHVRTDEHYDGKLIPGAIRMPWSIFRTHRPAENIGEVFVGASRAQELLGQHGIGRTSLVVRYDSVERDGGAPGGIFALPFLLQRARSRPFRLLASAPGGCELHLRHGRTGRPRQCLVSPGCPGR